MVCQNHGRLWSMKRVLIFVCDMCCTSENPLPVGEGVWSMCNTMKTGRYGASLSTVAWQMLTGSDLGTEHVHCRWCMVYRHVQLLRSRQSLGSAQNCPGPTGLQRSVCKTGAKESHIWRQSSLYGPFLYPLDMLHWTKRAVLELKHG